MCCQMSKKRISVPVYKWVLLDSTFPCPWGAVWPYTNHETSPYFLSHIWNGHNMIYFLKINVSQQNWCIFKVGDQLGTSFSVGLSSGHSTYCSKLDLVFLLKQRSGTGWWELQAPKAPRMKPREVRAVQGRQMHFPGSDRAHITGRAASEQFSHFRSNES